MNYKTLAEEFLQSVFRLEKAKHHRHISESMRGEEFVLQYLSRKDTDALPTAISRMMHCSTARVTAVLNSLEKKGYIVRETDANNRRQVLVRLTEAGRALAEERNRHVLEEVEKMLSGLGADDAREYVRITGKLVDMLPPADPNGKGNDKE